jgi:hypothetical protein
MKKRFTAAAVVVVLILAMSAIAVGQEGEILKARQQGNADAMADVNYFGCGLGGMLLGPFGWAHAWFAPREMSVERVLMLQDRSDIYQAEYKRAYLNAKRQMCTMSSIGGSLLWILALFYI